MIVARARFGHHPVMDPAETQPGRDARRPLTGIARATRRLVGLAGFLAAALLLAVAPVLHVTARQFGAAGDAYERVLIAYALAIGVGAVVAIVGWADWSTRSMLRAHATWAVVVVVGLAGAWAMVGIDSTRPLRELPEAALTYDGAYETWRRAEPAAGGWGVTPRAQVTRGFTTADPFADVVAFYESALAARGWSYTWSFESTGGERFVEWERDGYTIQLRLPVEQGSASGPFSVTIWGRPAR